MALIIQITKFKFCQYQLRVVLPNLMLDKIIRYTVCYSVTFKPGELIYTLVWS